MNTGWFLIGLAVGIPLGGLATYGAIFAWAVKSVGKEESDAK